jgi:hypothetical protein
MYNFRIKVENVQMVYCHIDSGVTNMCFCYSYQQLD